MDGYTGFTILTVIHLARALSHSDHAPPFFISEPSSAAVAEGQNVTLTCEAGPIGKVSVRWTYNGSEISPQSRTGITMMGSSLNIASFVAASEAVEHPSGHAGIYRCVAQNRVGAIISRPVALTSARLESCHQKLVHETVSVTAGNTVILPCRGISKPSLSPEVVFEHNGAALKTSSRHKLLPSHSLQIENTTSSDGGTYRCICPSTFPPHRIVASVVQLKVEAVSNDVPSEFISTSPRDVQVIEGETLTLECAAAGWPVPLITWLRYGGVLPMSRHSQHAGILRISEVQKVDEGTYICRAENTAGPPKIHVVFVDVLEPPKILLAPTDHTVTEGSRVTFGCKAEGSPRPTVAWYHNARPVVNSSLAKINSDGALVLMDIQENQSGMYQCIVSNQVNSSSASARLIVRPATPTSLGHQRHGPSDKKIDRSSVHPLRRSTVTMPTTQPLDFPDGEVESYSRIPDTGTAKDSPDESKSLLMQSDGERSGPRKLKGTRTYERNRPRKTTTQRNAGVSLVPPSKPTVSLVSDTSVQLRWSIGPSEGLNVTLFKVQFKEIKTRKHRKSAGWHTIDEDIAPDISEFTVSSLKPGSTYQFRLVAIYSNNDNKHGPNSDRLLMSMTGQKTKAPLTPPIIVAVHPLSVSEIDISWQFMPAKREVVNGFMIHYKPYETDLGYKQHVVHGSDEREVLLSNLLTDTTYSLRMQSFNAEGFSDYSNTVVKKTMGPSDNITDNYYPLNNHTPLFPLSGDDHRPFYNDRGATSDQGSTPRSGIESQVPLNRASYSQQNSDLLFVVLGGVLGAVFIVVVFVIVFCFWRQRQQQLLIATLQARAKANSIQRPSLHANDFAAASSAVNYEMESVSNTHPDTSRRKRTQQQSRKGGDIPGYVEGRTSKGANGAGAGVVGGFRSGNHRCHLYQPTTQEEWKSEFPFIVQSLGRRPPPITDAYALADNDNYRSRSDVDMSDGDSSLASSSCPARRQQWTSSAGDCGAPADDDEIYNSESLPYPPPRSSSSSSHPHAAVSSFRPLHQHHHHHHHLPSSKIHDDDDDDEQTMNIICDCDQFSCQPHPLSTEPLAPSSGDALEKLTDCHNPHNCLHHHRRGDEGNNSQSGQSDSLPRSCALSDCSSSSSSASSSASCNQRCRARQQYNRETNDSGVYDETSDCKHHSTADCRAAGDQCQVSA